MLVEEFVKMFGNGINYNDYILKDCYNGREYTSVRRHLNASINRIEPVVKAGKVSDRTAYAYILIWCDHETLIEDDNNAHQGGD